MGTRKKNGALKFSVPCTIPEHLRATIFCPDAPSAAAHGPLMIHFQAGATADGACANM